MTIVSMQLRPIAGRVAGCYAGARATWFQPIC